MLARGVENHAHGTLTHNFVALPMMLNPAPELTPPEDPARFIVTAFAQHTAEAASTQWHAVADQIRPEVPKLADLMDAS